MKKLKNEKLQKWRKGWQKKEKMKSSDDEIQRRDDPTMIWDTNMADRATSFYCV